jgi:hypothetical protein
MPDCYHVGVFEAAMEYFRMDGEVLTRVRSSSDVDIMMAFR